MLILLIILISAYYYLKTFKKTHKTKILIVLGSGGHTAEMLYMLESLDFKNFSKITFLKSNKDTQSKKKTINFLKEKTKNFEISKIEFINIKRVFYKKGFLLVSIISFLFSIFKVFFLIFLRENPKKAFFNGPGTCVPILIVMRVKRVCIFISF